MDDNLEKSFLADVWMSFSVMTIVLAGKLQLKWQKSDQNFPTKVDTNNQKMWQETADLVMYYHKHMKMWNYEQVPPFFYEARQISYS